MSYGDQAKPFGLSQVKFVSLTTPAVLVALEASQVLEYTPRLLTGELEGSGKIVAVHSEIKALDWKITEGGLPIAALNIMMGFTAVESGSTPTRTTTTTFHTGVPFPDFMIYGKALNEAGGDMHVKIFKAKLTSPPSGGFKNGEFQVTEISGSAVEDAVLGLWQWIENETATALPVS